MAGTDDPETNTETRKVNQDTASPIIIRIANPNTVGGGGGSTSLSVTDLANAKKAVAQVRRKHAQLTRDAATEAARIAKCLQHETKVMKAAAPTATNVITKPAAPKHKAAQKPAFAVGEYVQVEADLSPYQYCFGGRGVITAIEGQGEDVLVDVDLATGSKANGVPPSRLTKLKIDTPPPQRACKYAAPAAAQPSPKPPVPPLIDSMRHGAQHNQRKGFRRLQVLGAGSMDRPLTTSDYLIIGAEYRGLEAAKKVYAETSGVDVSSIGRTEKAKRSGKFKKGRRKWASPFSKMFFAHAWGISRGRIDTYAQARHEVMRSENRSHFGF